MEAILKVLVFKEDYKVLITKIREVQAEFGEPNCELIDPVEFRHPQDNTADWKKRLHRWPGLHVTSDNKCMIQSDAILTLVDPESEMREAYYEVISKS